MCQVSPGASSPVILVLSRHLPVYGFFGLYLFTTTPSSIFLDSFATFAGASVVTWALIETTVPPTETSLYCKGTWETKNHVTNSKQNNRSAKARQRQPTTFLKEILSGEIIEVLEDREDDLDDGKETVAVTAVAMTAMLVDKAEQEKESVMVLWGCEELVKKYENKRVWSHLFAVDYEIWVDEIGRPMQWQMWG